MKLSELPFPQPVCALWTVHPGDLLGQPITWLTHGPVSHAGFLRSDRKTIAEAYLPCVRCRPLLDSEKPGILLFAIEGMTPVLAAKFERFFDIATDPKEVQSYSIRGLFDYEFNLKPENPQNVFCSQWYLQTFTKLAPDLKPVVRIEADMGSPVDLYHSPRHRPLERD